MILAENFDRYYPAFPAASIRSRLLGVVPMDPAPSSHPGDDRLRFFFGLLAQTLQSGERLMSETLQSGERLMSESTATLREVCERQAACAKAVCATNLESTVQIANMWLASEVRVICLEFPFSIVPVRSCWGGELSSSWGGVVSSRGGVFSHGRP
jgi:hypothetical protein